MELNNCAILIPTRNRPGILANTLSKLQAMGLWNLPLLVYDDASEDPKAIVSAVEGWSGGGKVIRGEIRIGQAGGRNILMKQCGKEFGIFLDDDSYFLKIGHLARYITEDYMVNKKLSVISFHYVDIFKPLILKKEGYIDSFSGGGSLYHIPSVLSVGGYRDFFIYGNEEPELSMRLWVRGFFILYDPTIIVEHNHREVPEERRDSREYYYLYTRNLVLMYVFNLPLVIGFMLGLCKSILYGLKKHCGLDITIRGIRDSLRISYERRRERTPAPFTEFLKWTRYRKRNSVC